MFQRDETRTEARQLLKYIVDRQPDNQVALWYLSQSELLRGNASAAAALSARLATLTKSAVAVLAQVRALTAEGNFFEARSIVQRHVERDGKRLDRRRIDEDDLIDLLLLEITGQASAADELSWRMCREDNVALLDWSGPSRSWIDAAVLDRTRKSAAGRDIAIFGRGPSLNRVRNELDQLRSRDFIISVINDFYDLSQTFLAPLGRKPELMCFTNYDLLRASSNLVLRALEEDTCLALCLPSFVRDALMSNPDDKAFRAHLLSSSRLLFFGAEKEASLPIPSDPLMFPCVNTLMCALGAAMLACPRRIFLFGFDGRVDLGTGDYYYGNQSTDYSRGAPEDVQRHTREWLWWDAFRFNHIAPCFVRQLHHLHDVNVPIVYNVCPESAITCFPRISVGDFLDLSSPLD